jgi:CheY-like chemotaxis protein
MDYKLPSYLAKLKQENFTGKLNVSAIVNPKFQIYFYLGRLLWADGGFHANRAWQRYLIKYCPHIDFESLSLPALERFEHWKYYLLTILHEENFCDKEKLIELVNIRVAEVIFDIFFAEYSQKLEYKAEIISHKNLDRSGFKHTIALLDIEHLLHTAEREWWSWQDNNFQNWHPDLVPLIIHREMLEKSIYTNFSKKKIKEMLSYINGENSLRDLASDLGISLLETIYSLAPYIRENSIELMQTPDISAIKTSTGSLLSNIFGKEKHRLFESQNFKGFNYQPLVVCLDNDDRTIATIATVVQTCDYRFMELKDPLQAIEIIFEHQPDLFFINSNFNEFDSYALAIKLRKIAQFKDAPIYFMSLDKCREDRLKAKIIGINDILEKPLKVTHILNSIEQHLSVYRRNITENPLIAEQKRMEAAIDLIVKNL